MTAIQRQIVDMLMEGYTLTDIAEIREAAVSTINTQFRRAVRKIVETNDRFWRRIHGKPRE